MTKLAIYVGYNISYFPTTASLSSLSPPAVHIPTNPPLLPAAAAKALFVLQDQEHPQQER